MNAPIHFPGETQSNSVRATIRRDEPVGLRTFTPSQLVIARSAGVFHWTPEGRRLYDYTSGVLVANLGHNPVRWMHRLCQEMQWTPELCFGSSNKEPGYLPAVPWTAYNAITDVESQATERLIASLQQTPKGARLQSVFWAASGSEAVQKALWACLQRDEQRPLILATRNGFHGKKGLAGAVTGSEKDHDRDPRVHFIRFPQEEIDDLSKANDPFDFTPFEVELDELWRKHGSQINCLITEPYLGGGGSYHPPAAYLQGLERWCRTHDVVLILDEIQSNFGRTGSMYAFEKHGITPDIVCLGKGLGNGVPVSAAVGRTDLFNTLGYGAGSDTWSANPLGCAAVIATLDEFETEPVLAHAAKLSQVLTEGLVKLKATGSIAKVRGEGMVFGLECTSVRSLSPAETAIELVRACYLGDSGGDGVHLLGPLAGRVIRVSPPMTMTLFDAEISLGIVQRACQRVAAGS